MPEMRLLSQISSAISREVIEANWFSGPGKRVPDLMASAGTLVNLASVAAGVEFKNKLKAFSYFRNPNGDLSPAERRISWLDYVGRAREQGAYASIWLFEGRAAWLSEQAGSPEEAIRCLNSIVEFEAQEERTTWLPLHTGTGMTVARRILENMRRVGDPWNLDSFLNRVNSLADSCRMRSHSDCVYEAAGLVIQTLYPNLVEQLGQPQTSLAADRLALIWHGIGRGLYFDPLLLLPGMPLRRWSLDRAVAAALSRVARANLVAGYFWALVLVNIRHPEVLTNFLNRNSPHVCDDYAPAIADGVSAAVMVWQYLTGDSSEVARFLGHRSPAILWSKWILPETQRRLSLDYDRLSRTNRIAEIFCFRERAEFGP